ncbi:50S ribosomal protein L6 [Candidatus Woesearchaeota archaeon]|nr:50S ribosomal protein L6 [Candidatus Woesearchaeota archaeon]
MAKEKKEIKAEIGIPEGASVEIEGPIVRIKGKAGEVAKKLFNPKIRLTKEGNNLVLKALRSTKREQKLVNTFRAHIKNMLKGSGDSYNYKLKICSGHFPMNVSVKGNEFIVKNFFGEKIPRILKIKEGVTVKVEGDIVLVSSADKELAGQVAADIEHLVKRTRYDLRIFQDGIYITEKAGTEAR